MVVQNTPLRSMFAPVRALFVGDATAGILLMIIAAAAMLAANSSLAPFITTYFTVISAGRPSLNWTTYTFGSTMG